MSSRSSSKPRNNHAFDDIAADELTLWKVNISQNELPELDADADPATLGKKLSPLSKIAEVFPDGVEEKHIHIIVVRPVVKELQESDLELTGWDFLHGFFLLFLCI